MRTAFRVLFLIVLSALFSSCAHRTDFFLTVLLTEGAGYSVESENPLRVRAGDDAVFYVSLDEGYQGLQVIGQDASYEDGVLSVGNVNYPKTLELVPLDFSKNYKFFLETNANGGKLTSSVEQGKHARGTKISVSVSLYEGVTFDGWSFNKSARSGGAIVSSDLLYSFFLEEDTFLFANFVMPPKQEQPPKINPAEDPYQRVVFYNANGGTVTANGKNHLVDTVSTKIYPMPNSLASVEIFERDGYILTEYNTSPDGTGESFGLGHPIRLDRNGDITYLFCIWAKCSEESLFQTSASGNSVRILSYLGDEQTVVVPERIGGKTVTRICEGAFYKKSFETLIFPNTITHVETNAVIDCQNMRTLYLFDTVREIFDHSFSFTAFQTLFLNAAMAPRYTTSGNSFSRKWQRLVTNADKNRIVVVSGSSTYHGLHSPMLEEMLDGGYCVVNYGTHGASNILLYLDAISTVLHEGDIVVYAPEQLEPVLGETALSNINFYGWESCYDMFRHVDISKYTEVFSAFTEYNGVRFNMTPRTYRDYASGMSEYGERATPIRQYNSDDFLLGANGTFYFQKGIISQDNAARLNAVFDRMKSVGAEPVLSFPPFNINAVDPATLNEESYDEYMSDLREILDIPLISDVRDYIMPAKYMSDTDYHMNDFGRDLRTKQLAKDLQMFLARRNAS